MFANIRSLILIIIAVAVFFLYTNKTFKEVSSLKQNGSTFEQALNNSKQFEQARDAINARYQSFSREDIERLKLLLPDTVDNVRLVIDIENIAKNSGLVFKKVTYDAKESIKAKTVTTPQASPKQTTAQAVPAQQPVAPLQPTRLGSATEDNKPYGSFSVSFTVQGPYDQFLQFLKTLESSLRIVDVTSITFSSVENVEKDPKKVSNIKNVYEYNVTIKTYWLKD